MTRNGRRLVQTGRTVVAIVLAVGIATAINVITIAVLWTAVADRSDVRGGLSENATQILTTAFGGMIGVLGAYLGFRAGQEDRPDVEVPPAEPAEVDEP